MATLSQAKGALLEEAILQLLTVSGFEPVVAADGDPTLYVGPAGLFVRGRGEGHQADALADFRVAMPFGYPTRLVVEAKCFGGGKSVGLRHVRNAVGVLKDISEYYVPPPSGGPAPARSRYHYRYALFSATPFARTAERYAFAQDISLVPLGRNAALRPVVDALQSLQPQDFGARSPGHIGIDLHDLRITARRFLSEGDYADVRQTTRVLPGSWLHQMDAIRETLSMVDGSLLARANKQFLLFLTPIDRGIVRRVREESRLNVRIRFRNDTWYLSDRADTPLFTFDLPDELFLLYDRSGMLASRRTALNLKEQYLNEIQAIYSDQETVQLLTFDLDEDWISSVRATISSSRR